MTKKVRIENADTSPFKVIVEVWDRAPQSINDPLRQGADILVKTIELSHPTAMTGDDCYITSTRYLVVKEAA